MEARSHGMEFSHSLEVVAKRLDSASTKLANGDPALVEVGVYLLGEAQRDFRAKSRGEADKAGNTWPGITEGAIRSRFWRTRRNSQYVKMAYELQSLRNREESLLASLLKTLPRGKNAVMSKWRAGIAAKWRETPEGREATKLRQRIKSIRERRTRIIASEHAKAKTGIDSGRLVNSLQFGKALLEVASNFLTLGTQIVYAKWFDLVRPIFPENFITPQRMTRIESICKKHAEKQLRESLGDSAKEG